MAIQNYRMQQKRGEEVNFDPDKMLPGEWAVSLDTKYVRMCFSPGVCVRMATYEAFEADMAKIQKILEECQTIEEAVKKIQEEINAKEIVIEQYVQNAKTYSETAANEADRATLEADRAKTEADRASSIANIGIATTEKAGIVKPDGKTITVDADGTIHYVGTQGTIDYEELENKPSINGVELSGNKALSDFGIASSEDLDATNETVASNSVKIEEVGLKVDTIIEKAELNIKNSTIGDNIHLKDSANNKVVEFGLYGKATQDGKPTPDNPIEITVSGSDGSVEVVSCRKNLLENTAESQTSYGIEFTVNTDGSVRASGTQTGSPLGFALLITDNWGLKDGTEYILSGANGTSGRTEMLVVLDRTTSSNVAEAQSGNEARFTYVSGHTYEIKVELRSTGTTHDVTFYPMIRLASDTDDTYEPYKETVSTIPTPNGLAGIKVSSGGNYTDENGQQWICDEVVKYADGSGKKIQRIGKTVITAIDGLINTTLEFSNFTRAYSNAFEDRKRGRGIYTGFCDKAQFLEVMTDTKDGMWKCNFNNESIYSQFFYINFGKELLEISASDDATKQKNAINVWLAENPFTVYYVLEEPIITDLSAEEIAEIEKLHTFYPVTNISNDADCGMSVTYLCDAKNYIDNRLALIESAMLNNI